MRLSDESGTYPPIEVIEWTDATNIATWTDLDELAEWAKEGGFVCRNIGYVTYEDDDCVVLSARIALDAEPAQHGLFERLPKGMIIGRKVLDPGGQNCKARLDSDTKDQP